MHPAQKLSLFFGALWFIVGLYNLLADETSLEKGIFSVVFVTATTVLWLYLTGVLKHWFKR